MSFTEQLFSAVLSASGLALRNSESREFVFSTMKPYAKVISAKSCYLSISP